MGAGGKLKTNGDRGWNDGSSAEAIAYMERQQHGQPKLTGRAETDRVSLLVREMIEATT